MTTARTIQVPRSYTHDDMCSPDHDASACLPLRVDAATADLRAVRLAIILMGGAA
jgi:hypothetical protein